MYPPTPLPSTAQGHRESLGCDSGELPTLLQQQSISTAAATVHSCSLKSLGAVVSSSDIGMKHHLCRDVTEKKLPPLAQVEFYVLEYASSLAEGATTWQHALQYYACCPRGGRHAAESLIQARPLKLCPAEHLSCFDRLVHL